jgi:hypothetical protein
MRVVWFISCLAVVIGPAFAQERNAHVFADTSALLRFTLSDPDAFVRSPFVPAPVVPGRDLMMPDSGRTTLRRALLLQPSLFPSDMPEDIPILATLQASIGGPDNLAFVRSLLGTVQACGTAYAAYRAIKKYGLK